MSKSFLVLCKSTLAYALLFCTLVVCVNSELVQAECTSKVVFGSDGKYQKCQIENDGRKFEVKSDLMKHEEECTSFCKNDDYMKFILDLIGSHESIELLTPPGAPCKLAGLQSEAQSSGSSESPLDSILKREREFTAKNPCVLTFINVETFETQCQAFKRIYHEHGMNEANLRCEPVEMMGMKGGTITLLTDRILNQNLFGTNVKDCYAGRRSITLKQMPLIQDLVTHAEEYFHSIQLQERKPVPLEISPETSTPELLDKLFSRYNDVVLGEQHQHITPKKALIESMEVLKKNHVSIAFEHLLYEPYQVLIDQYMSSSSSAMPARLKAYLYFLDQGHQVGDSHSDDSLGESYSYTAVVQAAKKAGVRIIPIETEASYATGMGRDTGAEGTDRYKVMNYMDKMVTDRERRGGKILHFIGSAHTNTRENVLGVSELMNHAPSIVISDGGKKPRSIQRNVNEGDRGIKADFHILEPTQ